MSRRKDELDGLRARLQRWAVHHHDPDATIDGLEPLDERRHRFDVVFRGAVVDALVLHLDEATAMHEARVLAMMRDVRVAVPELRFWDDDPQWFGQAYTMVERCAAQRWVAHVDARATGFAVDQAVETLATIHRAPWRRETTAWPEPVSLGADVRMLGTYLAERDEQLAEAAGELTDHLLSTIPRDVPIGIVHGDFRMGNLLFGDGRVVGVVGWERSYLGGQLLDVGSLLATTDGADIERVGAAYAGATGHDTSVAELAWATAYACVRLGDLARARTLLT